MHVFAKDACFRVFVVCRGEKREPSTNLIQILRKSLSTSFELLLCKLRTTHSQTHALPTTRQSETGPAEPLTLWALPVASIKKSDVITLGRVTGPRVTSNAPSDDCRTERTFAPFRSLTPRRCTSFSRQSMTVAEVSVTGNIRPSSSFCNNEEGNHISHSFSWLCDQPCPLNMPHTHPRRRTSKACGPTLRGRSIRATFWSASKGWLSVFRW